MRIIRIAAALSVLLIISAPQVAKADEAQASNETKINFKIEDNLTIENGVMTDNSSLLLADNIKNSLGYEPSRFKEDKERGAVLAKYQDQLARANFPQGKFIIDASAYTAAADECGKSNGITASGLKVKKDETIACPPQFPFGTRINISGRGTYTCEDRGGAIKGNHIDIYMETKSEAFNFGRQHLEAEVAM